MADNDVRIKLSLDGADSVQSGLAGVGDGASQADSKLSSLVKGGLAGAGQAVLGLAVAGATAGAALSAAVVKSYADYEQNLGGIQTMFGETADKMIEYADKAYMTAGLSANEYMSQVTSFSAALLQGLGGDTAAAAEYANTAMTDMSDNANKFGSNIADIQNAYQGFAKQNFTMLDNLKLGYGGTASEMARLINDSGVLGDTMTVTAETVNQVSFDQVIAAIHKVQENMGIAGTTALEASTTIAGSIGMLKGSFDNLLTGLGSADADVATLAGNVLTSLETVITNITPVIDNIGSNMATLGPKLGDMMTGLVGAISSAIPAVLAAGTGMIEGLITGVTTSLPGLITAIVPGIVGLVGMIATQLPLLIDAGMKAVIALGQGLVQAIPTLLPMIVSMVMGIVTAIVSNLPMLLDTGLQLILALSQGLVASIPVLLDALPALITALVTNLLSQLPLILDAGLQLFLGLVLAIPQVIVALVEALPTIITAVIDGVIGAIPQMIESGLALFLGLIGALPEIITGIVDAIPQIIDSLVSTFDGSNPAISQAGYKLLTALVNQIGPAAVKIAAQVPQIIEKLVSAVSNGISQMSSAGYNLITGLWSGISNASGWLWGKISGWANSLIADVKGLFGIRSPSTVFRDEIGEMLARGTGLGIEQNEDKALRPLETLGKKLVRTGSLIPQATMDVLARQDALNPAKRQVATQFSLTPAPAHFASTQTVQLSASISDTIKTAFRDLSLQADLTSRISSEDMSTMADKVQSAIIDVRAADGKSASLAAQQGVR